MAESIKKTDLAANDVLANLIPTQAQIDMINKADEATARWAATVKNSLVNDKSSLAALQKQAELQAQLNTITKEKISTDNQRLILEQKIAQQVKLISDANEREAIGWRKKTTDIEENSSALIRQQKELENLKARIKAIGEESTQLAKYRARTEENTQKTKELAAELVALKTREVQVKESISQTNIMMRTQAKETNAVKGSMIAMNAELGQMRRLYRELSEEERSSPFGKNLQKQILFLDKDLKNLDDSIGNNQRNVGNYKAAFNGITGLMGDFGSKLNNAGSVLAGVFTPGLLKSTKAMLSSVKGFTAGGVSARSFGMALKSIPFLGIIAGITTIVALIWEWTDGTEENTEATEENTAANYKNRTSIEDVEDAIDKVNKKLAEEQAELITVFEALKDTTYGTDERKKALDNVNSIYGLSLKNMEDEAEFANQLTTAYDKLVLSIEKKIKAQVLQDKIVPLVQARLKLEEDLAISKEMDALNPNFGVEIEDFDNSKMLNVSRDIQFEIDEINKRIEDLNKIKINPFAGLFGGEGDGAGGEKTNNTNNTAKVKNEIDELNEYKKKKALELLEYENELIEQGVDRELIDKLLGDREIEQARDIGDKIIELGLENDAVMIEHRNDYLKKVEKLRLDHIKTTSDQDKEAQAKDLAAYVKELTDKENARLEAEKKRLEAEKKKEAELAELRKKTLEEISDAADALLDKNIERLKKEKDAAANQQNYLQDLAASGNITAKESLKAEIEAQREAEKEIMEMERKKATLKLVTTGLNTFSSEINSGKSAGEAFASTLVSIQALKTVLSGMNFFAKGTDNAPKGLAIVDELGAEIHTDKFGNIKSFGSDAGANLRHLDKGDKIITAEKSKNILSYISKINQPNKKGAASLNNNFQLISELKQINQSIKNQHSSTEFDSVFGEIIRTTSNNGVRIKSRYRS